MNKRNNTRVENVDFEKLRKCLENHGISLRELSKVCGYYPDYMSSNVFTRKFLNTHVRDVLTYAYKVDPSEYIDTQPKEVANTADAQQKEVINTADTQPKEVINPVDVQPKYYKFDPSEYFDTQPKEVINQVNDDMYTLTLSVNGKLLKKWR